VKTQEPTNYEQVISEIWSEILQKNGIGMDADFFDLGGTSQQLIHVVSKMGERFNLPLDTTIVLDGVTISALAKSVQRFAAAPELQVASNAN
jgi:hypothetical protein